MTNLTELWNWNSFVWWPVAIVLLGYFSFFGRVSRGHFIALIFALLAMVAVYVSPIGYLAEGYVFVAHMIQHLIMLLVVPFFIVLSLPKETMQGWLEDRCKPYTLKLISALGWISGVGAMWFWHVPSLCSISTQTFLFGFVRDLSFVLAGMIFWWPIYGPLMRTRLSPPVGILYLFTACIGCSLLGIYITFTDTVVCPVFASTQDSLGVLSQIQAAGFTPQIDQNVGGLLMWIPPCLLYVGAIISLLCRWYNEIETNHSDEQTTTPN